MIFNHPVEAMNKAKNLLISATFIASSLFLSSFCANGGGPPKNGPELYLPKKLYVYVTRGEFHGVPTTLTEAKIKAMFSGYGKDSINPLLLQVGTTFADTQVIVRNIRVPTASWNGSGNFCDGFRAFRPGTRGISLSDINGNALGRTVPTPRIYWFL